ncbi:hypothetical protein ACLMNJ_01590 [Streptomyces seoulensis]
MSDSEASTPSDPYEPPSKPLTGWERWAAGFLGFLMVGVGGLAVFTREVEGGPTALIAIGALLLVMAVTGAPITRARFGDNEVTLARQRIEAERVIAQADPQSAQSALAVMAAYDPTAPQRDLLSRIKAWERGIASALVEHYGTKADLEVRSRYNRRLDAVVRADDSAVAVEWYFAEREPKSPARALANHGQTILDSDFSKGVLVTNLAHRQSLVLQESERARHFGKTMKIVTVEEDLQELGTLFSAIDALLAEEDDVNRP